MVSKWFALVPCRGGSKGIPDKNLLRFGTLNVTERATRFALALTQVTTVVVSSDSDAILRSAIAGIDPSLPLPARWKSFSGSKNLLLHRRDSKMASDESKIMATVGYVARHLERSVGGKWGCVLIQPSAPFRSLNDAKLLDEKLKTASDESSIVSVESLESFHPARMFVESAPGEVELLEEFKGNYQAPRQQLPKAFIRDGSMYVIGAGLISQSMQVTASPQILVRSWPYTVNLDTQLDVQLASIAYDEIQRNKGDIF